jgi:hypothetical protein
MRGKRRGRARNKIGAWVAVGLGAGSVCALRPAPARADVLTAIGGFFGKPLGGFIGAASAPVISNVEGAANGVVANVDARVNKDMVNAGTVVNGVADHAIAGVGQMGQAWLNQANGIIGANVAQVFVDADSTISKAVGEFGALESKTVSDVNGIVQALNKDVQTDLNRIDAILDTRITQIDGVVKNAVSEADDDMKARINQADDVAQKALGTADVIAAKETLGIQGALLRVGTLLGMVAFLVAALGYLFEHLNVEHAKDVKSAGSDAAKVRKLRFQFAKSSVASLGVHLLFGAACIWLFLWLSNTYFPAQSQTDATALTTTHEKALSASLDALDFTKVRYHAAELAILNPGGEGQYRAVGRRADLIRTILSRPGLLASADGIRQLATLIDDAKRAQVGEDGGVAESADVLTAEGYVRWQLAQTRADEAVAVALFVHAIDVDNALPTAEKQKDLSRFVLKPAAVRYVRLFCARRPSAFVWPAVLTPAHRIEDACASAPPDALELPQFAPLARYDAAVLTLDAASDAAYVQLLDAQVTLDAAMTSLGKESDPKIGTDALSAAQQGALDLKNKQVTGASKAVLDAKNARLAAATKVRQAWLAFDDSLKDDSELPTSAQMSTFALNDVPLTQAAWVIAQPDDVRAPMNIAAIEDKNVRAVVSPARMTWASRYLGPLSAQGQVVAAHEVTDRYARDEALTTKFESAYIAYRKVLASGGSPAALTQAQKDAVAAASAMGLYASGAPRAPLAATFVDAQKAPPANVPEDGVLLRLL